MGFEDAEEEAVQEFLGPKRGQNLLLRASH